MRQLIQTRIAEWMPDHRCEIALVLERNAPFDVVAAICMDPALIRLGRGHVNVPRIGVQCIEQALVAVAVRDAREDAVGLTGDAETGAQLVEKRVADLVRRTAKAHRHAIGFAMLKGGDDPFAGCHGLHAMAFLSGAWVVCARICSAVSSSVTRTLRICPHRAACSARTFARPAAMPTR